MLIKWWSISLFRNNGNSYKDSSIKMGYTYAFETKTDNTLHGLKELETSASDYHLDASAIMSMKYPIQFDNGDNLAENKNIKEFFKTFFTFRMLPKNSETKSDEDADDMIVQYNVFSKFKPMKCLPSNSTEVLVEAIDQNELSIILPQIIQDNIDDKVNINNDKQLKKIGSHQTTEKLLNMPNQHVKQLDMTSDILRKSNSRICKSATHNDCSVQTPIKHCKMPRTIDLFNLKHNQNNEQNTCHIRKSTFPHNICDCKEPNDGSFSNSIYTREGRNNSRIEANWPILKDNPKLDQKQINKIHQTYIQKLDRNMICSKSNDDWCQRKTKFSGCCTFQKDLSKIKQSHVNLNANNKLGNNRTAQHAINHHYNPKSQGVQNGFAQNQSKSNYNESWNRMKNSNKAPVRCMKEGRSGCCRDLNNWHPHGLNSSQNCGSANQNREQYCEPYNEPCSQYYEQCGGSCCNPCPSSYYCSQENPSPMCCENAYQCDCCDDTQRNTYMCEQMNHCQCGQSTSSCAGNHRGNTPRNPDDSVQTIYCESPGSPDCCEVAQRCCQCTCRCPQFPKPAPYCLDTAYRMNYFQKCIPRFRRYQECDNLRLPLC